MADKVVGKVIWPAIPDGIDPLIKTHLLGMQKAVSEFLEGQAVCISGDLFVGGSIHFEGGESSDVAGPSGATDNALSRFDTATGKLLKDGFATENDGGSINIPTGEQYKVNGSQHVHSEMFDGLSKISVGTSTPSSPNTGDLWVDTN